MPLTALILHTSGLSYAHPYGIEFDRLASKMESSWFRWFRSSREQSALGGKENLSVDEEQPAPSEAQTSTEESLPPEIKEELTKLPEPQKKRALTRAKTWLDAVQPHTDEGGNANYIGDFYAEVDKKCLEEWENGVE